MHRSHLTPNLTFLPECPIILPLFPDPFRARTSFPDFTIIGLDCGENCGRYLIIVVGVANDQRRDVEGERLSAWCASSNEALRQAFLHRNA